jgi:Flp pilus assembly protein TadG
LRSDRGCDGSVTAETAVVLPVLVLVVAVLLGLARVISGELAVEEAAGVGARAAARGESAGEVVRLASKVAPPGAAVSVERRDGLVTVRVSAALSPLGLAARLLPELTVTASARALDESAGGFP